MPALTADRFAEFYQAVHGYAPFPWQSRMANRACAGDWPAVIALPTAAGKTACIDIAVFALACQAKLVKRTAARRIFFVVDRRVVVDQAFIAANALSDKLTESSSLAGSPILQEVADALRLLSGCDRPLDVYVLRGGMYREDVWVRTPLQPTVICSTVDQVGSRLLFRGYGVSDSMKPVHAGLVGNDSLILLDEAHCARPFSQTTESVARYRNWNTSLAPFTFVTMTATPDGELEPAQIERDNEEDQQDPILGKRIRALKPSKLVISEKAKGKKYRPELVKTLAEQARGLMTEGFQAVGIIVNRVATARELATTLRLPPDKKIKADSLPKVILLTGRMRPLDRDLVFKELQPLFSNGKGDIPPTFVVATQCLECGADLDLHALVTECASLDALRQRFGRLNRVAARDTAKGVIVVRGDQTDNTEEDPVYGVSLANTWKWLNEQSTDGTIDFGIAAMRALTEFADLPSLNAPTTDAPILLPAHLDCWVQTSPIPTPDPDPALFLHGPGRTGEPDVQVILRGDLGDDSTKWAEVVGLCPPSSSEALPVRISQFRKWLVGEIKPDESADMEGGNPGDAEEIELAGRREALCWAGPTSEDTAIVNGVTGVQPNRTYLISQTSEDLELLGDFPRFPPSDDAEEAFQRSRDRVILRLPRLEIDPEAEDFEALLTSAIELAGSTENAPEWRRLAVKNLSAKYKRSVAPYPEGMKGFVVTGRRRLGQFDPTFSDDESTFVPSRQAITLEDHTKDVVYFAEYFSSGCGLPNFVPTFVSAAKAHDVGKADPRFQAMLQGRSPRTVRPPLWAKSAVDSVTFDEQESARRVHQFPKGGRHEMLSLAAMSQKTDEPLLLHLIASHHGHARPFAPPLTDTVESLPSSSVELLGETYSVDPSQLSPRVANISVLERFWKIVRSHGWWGSAYIETIFRLADHAASRIEQEPEYSPPKISTITVPAVSLPCPILATYPLPLMGLDGSNPLAFLAALGTLNVLHHTAESSTSPEWLRGKVTLSWGWGKAAQIPVLHLSGRVDQSEFIDTLVKLLPRTVAEHSCGFAVNLLEAKDIPLVSSLRKVFADTTNGDRHRSDWYVALLSEMLPEVASQLQTVRKDYLIGNLKAVMQNTRAEHLIRSLFYPWDYADKLANQSLHWEPTEDRRHAYQWFMPSGDPTRNRQGGMLGANRLAIEGWTLFPSFPNGDRLSTRGFRGNKANNTWLTWPLWASSLPPDAIASLLSLPVLQAEKPESDRLRDLGVTAAFRLQRILVGKTPNFTTARAVG